MAIAALGSIAAGCGGPEYPPTYPVTGVLTMDGQPIEGAQVVFHSDTTPRLPSGTTDADGKFRLTMVRPDDGAMEGEYSVTVYKPGGIPPAEPSPEALDENHGETTIDLESEEYAEAATKIAEGKVATPFGGDSLLPPRYADPSTTELKYNVSATAENHFEIQLTK